MNKYIAALFASFCANIAFATTWYVTVDAHNADYGETGETASGESWDAAITLTNAVAKAQAGDTILVEGGTYDMTKFKKTISVSKALTIQGGMNSEENGALSIFDGKETYQPITLAHKSGKVILKNLQLTKGKPYNISMKNSTDSISAEFYDCEFTSSQGSGLGTGGKYVGNSSIELKFEKCTFAHNKGLYNGNATDARQNGGLGVYLESLGRVYFDNCLFKCNGDEESYTSSSTTAPRSTSGGAAIYAKNAPVTVQNCRFLGNRSHATVYNSNYSYGIVRLGGTGEKSTFINCVWSGNDEITSHTAALANGGGIVVVEFSNGSTKADFVNCTFANNLVDSPNATAGISVKKGCVSVINSIFYGSVTSGVTRVGRAINVWSGASAFVTNCLFESFSDCTVDGTGVLDMDSISCIEGKDPLFVYSCSSFSNLVSDLTAKYLKLNIVKVKNAVNRVGDENANAFNVHLRGARGYFDENTGEFVKGYKGAENQSPAIDAGINVFEEFKERNGNKVNLGFYGNTPWATMSSGGFMIIIR